jgi:uncharacterized membrane protein YkoI
MKIMKVRGRLVGRETALADCIKIAANRQRHGQPGDRLSEYHPFGGGFSTSTRRQAMKPAMIHALLVLATLAAVAPAGAQQTTQTAPRSDVPAKLAREAKIALDSARSIAQAKLPRAAVQSEELERENGKLIYSFDMKTAGKSGIDEVNVNAINGSIVGKIGHESAQSEAKEAKAERAASRKKPR